MSKQKRLGYYRVEVWDGERWRQRSTPYATRSSTNHITHRQNGVRVVRVKEGMPC